MKQAQRVLSTYAVDMFGIASALYELNGLIVMHDASGCNSTYSTHDEPRWYDTPSMIYISGLREIDTIQGNDEHLIHDVAEAALEAQPKFIAIGGSPMPNAIGTDFKAIEKMTFDRTGITTMGFRTDGIHSYIPGAGAAYVEFAKRFLKEPTKKPETPAKRVNILGLTPLDFSVVGNATTIKKILEDNDFIIQSSWSMGDNLENMSLAANADVNAVVSSTGFYLALYMKEKYNIPFVIGIPMGKASIEPWVEALRNGDSSYLTGFTGDEKYKKVKYALADLNAWKAEQVFEDTPCEILLIGEPVHLLSLRKFLQDELHYSDIRMLCPLADAPELLLQEMEIASVEEVIEGECKKAKHIIADPIYSKLLPNTPEKFIRYPHEAYSGRHYREEIPLFVGEAFSEWANEHLKF